MIKNTLKTKAAIKNEVREAILTNNPKAVKFKFLFCLIGDKKKFGVVWGFAVNGRAFETANLEWNFLNGMDLAIDKECNTLNHLKEIEVLLQAKGTKILRPGGWGIEE